MIRHSRPALQHEAKASYYGRQFEGRKTASGNRFSNDELTAASPSLPLGTKVQVTNKETGRRVQVQVTDRMPPKRGKAIDLSERAAKQIGIKEDGTALVRITVLE
jgi:rare lipoprotein A